MSKLSCQLYVRQPAAEFTVEYMNNLARKYLVYIIGIMGDGMH